MINISKPTTSVKNTSRIISVLSKISTTTNAVHAHTIFYNLSLSLESSDRDKQLAFKQTSDSKHFFKYLIDNTHLLNYFVTSISACITAGI